MPAQSTLSTTLRHFHIPGKPILLTNIYDAMSARAVAALPATQALATASYAVAGAAGVKDDDMTLETNLAAVRAVSVVAKEYGLPLTIDWQDGYGDRLEEGIQKLLQLGVVGINLEDCDKDSQKMIPIAVAAERVKRVLATARAAGVDDFVVNARTDALIHDGPLSDAIERGKAYLAAGATTVFVWGGSIRGGVTREEVKKLVDAFDGKLNVSLKIGEGGLSVKDLARIGVARISIGPALQFLAMKTFGDEAEKVLATR
ncbi:related to carboxyphosphonoenolpyruvate phosphonomutase-like protein [Phialocephala subalpina]|uniref:Related to carboxyphosphonoenolpyruvate phosphonomutase-like protein n=1 Tax=Phialocephala subalpina TaxID=576137 RepID=A0A1L7XVR7_9HELO|nr:related to carboxyphosphonoenolpyruvate phosphonomutase-like protein [Phialocephala subalpina]